MTEREAMRRARQSASDRETNDRLSAAERRAVNGSLGVNGSLTLNEWCSLRRVSRSMFYKLENQGLGPRTHSIGTKRLISAEADAAWLAARETEAA